MMTTCPICGHEGGTPQAGHPGVTHRICDECTAPCQCPVCGADETIINIALHLSGRHHWKYAKVQDWMQSQDASNV